MISTAELAERPSRAPDYESESRALVALSQEMTRSPQSILECLAATALELCRADSAGLSLLESEHGRQIFRWHAVAGRYAPNVGGSTPREFSPCGTVLDRNQVMLFSRPGRHFPYLENVTPPIVEALLVPLSVRDELVGTIWVMANDARCRFDVEDARVLSSLAKFAAAAHQVVKSLEATRAADQRKSEFLAMLGHELRNPLAPLWNAVGLLKDLKRWEDLPAVSAMMDRQIKHLVRLVDDLLDVSRIAQGKIELKRETVDLADVVRQAVDQTRPLAQGLSHHVDVRAPARATFVDGDPVRLVQIVGNLLSNACKFTAAGGRIELSLQRDGEFAILRVRDYGIGIAPDQLEAIFDMFAQADASLDRSNGGLGVGLALAKRLAEIHGGSIEASSAGVGQGSTFSVRLPATSVLQ